MNDQNTPRLIRHFGALQATALNMSNMIGIGPFLTIPLLMSALGGLGVDNAYVDIDAPELPIMDGSASPFVLLIQQAGIEEQAAPKKFLRVMKRVEVQDGDKWARFEPYDGYRLSFSIEFRHPVIERTTQAVTVDFAETSYLKEIARARTFGFMHEVEDLRDVPAVARDLALVKVAVGGHDRGQLLRVVDETRAHIVDSGEQTMTLEITGEPPHVDAVIARLEPLGIVEMVRTGQVAMRRGDTALSTAQYS